MMQPVKLIYNQIIILAYQMYDYERKFWGFTSFKDIKAISLYLGGRSSRH